MPSVANFYSGTLAYILSEIDSSVEEAAKPQGGRPSRLYAVNPAVHALTG
jgi:hypothetical protein